jgi:hypothetical protein
VEVVYYRGLPVDDPAASPADFAGHAGWLLPEPDICWAMFVQRAYFAGGLDRVEGVWVGHSADGGGEELCQKAESLATAAARRLPPPS